MKFLLLCIVLLLIAGMVVLALALVDKRLDERRRLKYERDAIKTSRNPDAAWLYEQGLSPEAIEKATNRRRLLE